MKKKIALLLASVMILLSLASCMRITVEIISPHEYFNGPDKEDETNDVGTDTDEDDSETESDSILDTDNDEYESDSWVDTDTEEFESDSSTETETHEWSDCLPPEGNETESDSDTDDSTASTDGNVDSDSGNGDIGDESADGSESGTESETESESESESESDEVPVVTVIPDALLGAYGLNTGIMNSSTTCKELICKDLGTVGRFTGSLIKAGYKQLEDINTIEGALFTTTMYVNNEYVVTVNSNTTASEARITWELLENNDLSLLTPNETTGTGSIEVVQIGVGRDTEKDNPLNGMCYIIKLSDGRAVIIDGGFDTEICASNLFRMIKAMEIKQDDQGRYVIAAWILSHGHGDHVGTILHSALEYSTNYYIENLIHNLPGDDKVADAHRDSAALDLWVETAFPYTKRVNPHAGLKYYIGNMTVSMFYTPEMIYKPDGKIAYYNDTSMVFKVEAGGASVFFYGDSGEEASTAMWNSYEATAFKSDILQITHHGLYTGADGHTWTNLGNVYAATQATYAYLPMHSRYASDTRNGRHTVMIQWCDADYQISFVMNEADNHGKDTITQDYYEQFVASVANKTNEKKTLYGYDGINKVVNEDGLITFLGSNEAEPMVTFFTLGNDTVDLGLNVELSGYFEFRKV